MTETSDAPTVETRPGNLYLRPVDAGFDPERDVMTDPWCAAGAAGLSVDWTEIEFSDPFADADDLVEQGENVRRLAEFLVGVLGQELNDRHGTRYSADFWHVVLIYWVMELTQLAWARYLHLRKIVDDRGGRPTRAAVLGAERTWDFADADAFARAVLGDDDFHWWLDSAILAELAPAAWELVPAPQTQAQGGGADPAPAAPTAPTPPPASPTVRTRLARWLKNRLGYTNIVGARFAVVWIALYKNLIPKRVETAAWRPRQGPEIRDRFPDGFLRLLDRLLHRTMPRTFGEDFPERVRRVAHIRFSAGRLRLGALDQKNDGERLIFALAQENGERLVQFQHGGSYGVLRANAMVAAIEYRNRIFATWGWTGQADYEGRFQPMPSPWLSRYADKHRARGSALVMAGTVIRLRLQRIQPIMQPAQAIGYILEKERFVGGLDPGPRRNLRYRPYRRGTNDFDDVAYLGRRGVALETVDGDFEKAVLGCRLLVLDHDSTTLNLALAAGVPTVCFFDPGLFQLCRQARPYYDALADAKMIFPDAAAAARHVNDVWDDVDAWWRDAAVQRARRDWVGRFALNSRFWWWDWMKTLHGL